MSYFCIFIGVHNYFSLVLLVFSPLATACSLLPAGQFANETAVPIWTQSGQHLRGNWNCTKAACMALPDTFVSSLILVAITQVGRDTAGLGRT